MSSAARLSQAAKPAATNNLQPLCEHSDKHGPDTPGIEAAQMIHERFGMRLQADRRQRNRHQGAVNRLVMEIAQELF